jgi:type II secretory pathway pseudopilin PulG
MRRLISAAIVIVILGIVGGLVAPAILKVQDAAARTQCQNDLKQIGLALHNRCDTYGTFPPATIPNENLPCDQRLSWLVDAMPFIEQNEIYNNLDRERGWQDEPNLIPKVPKRDPHDDHIIGPPIPVGEFKLFRCPADPTVSRPDAAGLTNYVGISGVGADAADLRLGYPGVGFFGCERQLKIEDIKDGLANTIAVMETNRDIGPWTAGGFATVRPLDPAMAPYLGAGRSFGSGHWRCTQAVFADGSVHALTKSIQPEVLEALATIAGGEKTEPLAD